MEINAMYFGILLSGFLFFSQNETPQSCHTKTGIKIFVVVNQKRRPGWHQPKVIPYRCPYMYIVAAPFRVDLFYYWLIAYMVSDRMCSMWVMKWHSKTTLSPPHVLTPPFTRTPLVAACDNIHGRPVCLISAFCYRNEH